MNGRRGFYTMLHNALRGILPDKFIQHLSLFSNSVFMILQDTIFPDDISSVEKMLTEFVIKIEILFGHEAMTFNVHQMLHLTLSVRDLDTL
ncbi:hypothetical protein AVEN_256220-1 [Araneus ventricosus]|uniref:Uncharacterized protein n=1 Tax=Araneus ventricosus TaxID=182803 RepID=A0A4Y2LRS5_ARAVE|nr:hypothetical protein AVEN_256220-1 [Araneus ventricosus]